MKVRYTTRVQDPTGAGSDLGDMFIPRELFSQGGLWAWGDNSKGQLGDNTTADKSSPVQTISTGTNWKLVAGGSYHTAAIKADGTLWLWGDGSGGQLGNNAITIRSSPVQTISAGTNWKQVACGGSHTAAIKTDGTLWLWGSNSQGRLGDNTTVAKSSPVQTIAAGANWKQVACGSSHTAAIKTDGTLWLWGHNSYGQLGDNTVAHKSSPVQTIAAGTSWKQVAAGNRHTAAIKTDGTLWLWGSNIAVHAAIGQLGDNTTIGKSSPVQTISAGTNWKLVGCGNYHTAAIKTDGTLWLWGDNSNGQLGNDARTNRSSPVQTISGGTNWKQIAGGYRHTGAIKTDGTLWLWGDDDQSQLGDSGASDKSSPVQTIAAGANWKQVACGRFHTIGASDIF